MRTLSSRVVAISSLTLASVAFGQSPGAKAIKSEMEKELPYPVSALFDWTSIPAAKVVDAQSIEKSGAVQQSRRWLSTLLSSSFLPKESPDLRCVKQEVDGRDVIRESWSQGDWAFKSAQTASVFTIVIEPKPGTNGLNSKDPKVWGGKLLPVFSESLAVVDGQGRRGVLPGFSLYLTNVTFNSPKDLHVHGPVTFGTGSQQDPFELLPQLLPGKGLEVELLEKLKTAAVDTQPVLDPAAWYRNVAWWTDGERVGIYFLKREAGSPWVPSYAGELDGDWFSVEPRRARKKK